MDSTNAAELKTKWTDVVNYYVAQEEALEEYADERLSFIDVAAITDNYNDVCLDYEFVLQKICEITAARCLARPVPSGTGRKTLVQNAKNTIEQLQGGAPAVLDLMMAEILK